MYKTSCRSGRRVNKKSSKWWIHRCRAKISNMMCANCQICPYNNYSKMSRAHKKSKAQVPFTQSVKLH